MAEEKKELTFLEHLEELRWHLVRSAFAIVILAIAAFIFKDILFDKIILAPKSPDFITNKWLCEFGKWMDITALCINAEPFQLININLTGQFTTHINISLIAGLILAFPYVFWEIWRFIKPALYEKELKHTQGAVLVSSSLFLTGILFGYFLIVPLSLNFLGSYQVSSDVLNQINLKSYISTITSISLAGGIAFELPILIYILSKAGLVSSSFLKKYRRHSIIVILIISAIITPPDIFSQILVALPLFALYEVGIVIAKNIERKNK
ncbi:MAG: twin arginine-targeting protein translocase TatC [Bacteroidetes bacterium GWF2_33_16]|nr:MAG: twin arginine-targeting protein translocase TatC [Bacteroidetes bacterium GWE2_32_14]OFY05282.1 MAG: twin arginine-targeting protein translocase TatC [Bacteroidetes bacterium GWF2_33_16]